VVVDGVDMFYTQNLMVSPDGKWLVLSAPSKIKGSNDLDLYYSKLSTAGTWMEPVAFDSTINSSFNEINPYFDPSGQFLYFASQGHNSMGGYDLFRSRILLDSMTNSEVTNLGYPINTAMDDKTISMSQSGRYGYISSLREGGLGDLDIYRVVFKDVTPLLSYVHGTVFNRDSIDMLTHIKAVNQHIDSLNIPINREYKRLLLKDKDSVAAKTYLQKNTIPYEKIAVQLEVYDIKNKKKAGDFIVQERNAHYLAILPPGEYRLVFTHPKYGKAIINSIVIDDFDYRNQDLEIHVRLK
jgi:hypothetical protein